MARGDDGLTTRDAILGARERIGQRLHRTPVMSSRALSERTGTRVSLKLELFQKTGSFKPRGVLNALSHLTESERRRGVVSMSAGNHAQALAWGATAVGIPATIVMPTTAVRTKVDATKAYGGHVVQVEG